MNPDSWVFFNLDKKEAIFQGSITKFFFSAEPTKLIHAIFLIDKAINWKGGRIVCLSAYSDAAGSLGLKKIFTDAEWTQEFEFNSNLLGSHSLYDQLCGRSVYFGYKLLHDVVFKEHHYYSKYVLRNFTKKEYICGHNPPDPKEGRFTLGHAFLSLIVEGFHGSDDEKWVGDKFDLVEYNDITQWQLRYMGFRDISQSVNDHLQIYLTGGVGSEYLDLLKN